jgi:hypothetical protein
MVFKRPTGSRDDKPGKSTGRSSRGDDKPKRPATAKGKATPDGEKKNYPDRINHSKATGLVTISPKAILGTAHHLAIKNHQAGQNHIRAVHLQVMTGLKAISGMAHQVIKKAFRPAASHTLAGQQVAILKTGQKETLEQAHLPAAKENLTPAVHHLAKVKKDQKELWRQQCRRKETILISTYTYIQCRFWR